MNVSTREGHDVNSLEGGKGLDEDFFYNVRPLHLLLAFELREYVLNAAPYTSVHSSCSFPPSKKSHPIN